MADNTTPHIARDYDSGVTFTMPYYEAFHRETIKLIRSMNRREGRWLDTGCGTGTLVARASVVFPETTFFLVDPSGEMLEEAKRKLTTGPDSKIQILNPAGTGEIPSMLDGTFDIVTAIQSHHYLDREGRREAVLRTYELLKEDGVFITFENTRPRTRTGTELALNYWRQFHVDQGLDSMVVDRLASRFDRAFLPITIDEHISLLEDTGFRTVELLWHSGMQSGFYCIK